MSDTLNTPGAPLNQPGDLLGPDLAAEDPGPVVGLEEAHAGVAHLDVLRQLGPEGLGHGPGDVVAEEVDELLAVHPLTPSSLPGGTG